MCYSPLLSLYRHLFYRSTDCPKFGCWLLCVLALLFLWHVLMTLETSFLFMQHVVPGSSYSFSTLAQIQHFLSSPGSFYWLINTYTHNKTRKCVSVLISTSSKWEFCLFHILDNIWYCLSFSSSHFTEYLSCCFVYCD